MSGVIWPEIGDGVWWTNQHGGKVRAVCEIIAEPMIGAWIGLRIENGNFRWAFPPECSPRDIRTANAQAHVPTGAERKEVT